MAHIYVVHVLILNMPIESIENDTSDFSINMFDCVLILLNQITLF